MALVETHPLGNGEVELRVEDGYLRVIERGDPESVDAMLAYAAAMERARVRAAVPGVLVVAQRAAQTTAVSDWQAIREARWRSLAASSAERIAVIVDDELAVVRVRMAAIAAKAKVRAFVREDDAIAWLRGDSTRRA
ncbi:MAG: STAS/SEC14 domain-containing protein [Myxococcota bacterium]|nr:STAS/SEC14 domain-containing protein [Myxococcota bacterium]